MVTNNFQIFKFSQFLKKLDSADAESVIIKLSMRLLSHTTKNIALLPAMWQLKLIAVLFIS